MIINLSELEILSASELYVRLHSLKIIMWYTRWYVEAVNLYAAYMLLGCFIKFVF